MLELADELNVYPLYCQKLEQWEDQMPVQISSQLACKIVLVRHDTQLKS